MKTYLKTVSMNIELLWRFILLPYIFHSYLLLYLVLGYLRCCRHRRWHFSEMAKLFMKIRTLWFQIYSKKLENTYPSLFCLRYCLEMEYVAESAALLPSLFLNKSLRRGPNIWFDELLNSWVTGETFSMLDRLVSEGDFTALTTSFSASNQNSFLNCVFGLSGNRLKPSFDNFLLNLV